jgi:hypothetical protein
MTKLAELTEKLVPRQQLLTRVWNETSKLFGECQLGLLDVKARKWDRILFWMKSTKRDVIDSKPVNVYLKKETVLTYSGYWQRFICFLLRTTEDVSWRTDTHRGFLLTDEQSEKLAELRMFYEFDGGTLEEALVRRNLLLGMSLEFIRQDVYEVGTPALVYFAGVLGYDKVSGMWKEPINYTNKVAGILWCMHALVLEYSLPLDRREELGYNPTIQPIQRFKEVRDLWLVEEEDCLFATLQSLMNYGFQVSKDSVGSSKIRWSDDGQTILF